jgi:hypothetical protein
MNSTAKSVVVLGMQIVLAVALVGVGVYGALYAIQAARAQAMYHTAKYGAAKEDAKQILRLAEAAQYLYPNNYYFCIWAAEKAYYTSLGADKKEAQELIADSERWCETGLALNHYKSQLRLLKTHLLERKSVTDALKYWNQYVEWQFWDQYNHAVLAELYAKTGDFDKSFDELRWVKGSEHYSATAKRINEAWKKDMTLKLPSRRRAKPVRP